MTGRGLTWVGSRNVRAKEPGNPPGQSVFRLRCRYGHLEHRWVLDSAICARVAGHTFLAQAPARCGGGRKERERGREGCTQEENLPHDLRATAKEYEP
mmetsp:Transcript_2432/g.5662  ORF Transcript_2432/g.5662 Transcript_2432/m.5662 type:complete len:98 (+) Transcript_2432:863-1156(+)